MLKITLISSNIRFDNPADKLHSWKYRKSVLTQLLKEHNPVGIGTQEGRRPQLTELKILLNDYEMIDSHRKWIDERMYPTLFLKKNSFRLLESNDFWLSSTPHIAGSKSFGSAFPRLCTWARIQINENQLLIANVHLDHTSENVRIEQTNVLCSELLSIRKQDPMILMGDFNSAPGDQVRKILFKNIDDLSDPWITFEKDEKTSFHNFTGENASGSRIDWILNSKELLPTSIFLEERQIEGTFPSDHFPVVTNFSYAESIISSIESI